MSHSPLHKSEISIIVVEDDEGHAFLINKNLKRAGIANDITHLKNGKEAIDYLSGKEVRGMQAGELEHSLILLDLQLPLHDGFDVLEHIRKNSKTARTPVLILSSTTREQEIKRCYDLGCSIFLNKPVDYASFSSAVHQLGMLMSIVRVHT